MIKHLSFSSVTTYLKCHRKWKHRYIDRWEENKSDALRFGSAWGDMIRLSFKSKYEDLAFNWNEPFTKYFDLHNREITEDERELYNLGERMLAVPDIATVIKMLEPMPESIERKIDLNIPGVKVPIVGYIDMIENDTMIPVDFKTASKKWSQNQANSDLQATFYIAAMEQIGLIALPWKFRYIIFTKTKNPTVQILETERTARDIFELHEMVNDVWHGIRHKAFGKTNPSNWWCSPKYCGFYERCKGAD